LNGLLVHGLIDLFEVRQVCTHKYCQRILQPHTWTHPPPKQTSQVKEGGKAIQALLKETNKVLRVPNASPDWR